MPHSQVITVTPDEVTVAKGEVEKWIKSLSVKIDPREEARTGEFFFFKFYKKLLILIQFHSSTLIAWH